MDFGESTRDGWDGLIFALGTEHVRMFRAREGRVDPLFIPGYHVNNPLPADVLALEGRATGTLDGGPLDWLVVDQIPASVPQSFRDFLDHVLAQFKAHNVVAGMTLPYVLVAPAGSDRARFGALADAASASFSLPPVAVYAHEDALLAGILRARALPALETDRPGYVQILGANRSSWLQIETAQGSPPRARVLATKAVGGRAIDQLIVERMAPAVRSNPKLLHDARRLKRALTTQQSGARVQQPVSLLLDEGRYDKLWSLSLKEFLADDTLSRPLDVLFDFLCECYSSAGLTEPVPRVRSVRLLACGGIHRFPPVLDLLRELKRHVGDDRLLLTILEQEADVVAEGAQHLVSGGATCHVGSLIDWPTPPVGDEPGATPDDIPAPPPTNSAPATAATPQSPPPKIAPGATRAGAVTDWLKGAYVESKEAALKAAGGATAVIAGAAQNLRANLGGELPMRPPGTCSQCGSGLVWVFRCAQGCVAESQICPVHGIACDRRMGCERGHVQ